MENELLKTMHDIYMEARRIMVEKQKLYAAPNDCYKNFELINKLTQIPIESLLLSRMVDKVSRLANHTSQNVDRDSLKDSVIDLFNYAILYFYYIERYTVDNETR